MNTYTYKAFSENDINTVQALLTDVYKNDKFSLNYLKWQYLKNPFGRVISYNAFYQDKLVAHYAVIPQRSHDDKIYCLSVNTATSPDHLRKGLFTILAEKTYALAKQKGFEHIVGVANENSIHSFIKKLYFTDIGNVAVEFASSLKSMHKFSKDLNTIKYRLENPNEKFLVFYSKKENVSYVFTKQYAQYVYLGCLGNALTLVNQNVSFLNNRPRIFLLPKYGIHSVGIKIPTFLMPSPWHVIYRNLSNNENSSLKITGFDMDTF